MDPKKKLINQFKIWWLASIALLCNCSISQGATNVTGINFSQVGEISQIKISTDGPVAFEKKVNAEQKTIIIDVANAVADQKTIRPIDTSEFAGAVVYISAYPKPGSPNDLRFALQLRDNVMSKVETTTDGILIKVENKDGVLAGSSNNTNSGSGPGSATNAGSEYSSNNTPSIEQANQDDLGLKVPKSDQIEDILENITYSGKKKYIGKKISVNVRGVPVDDILNMIADTSGFNIFVDQSVAAKAPMTLSLNNVPWDEALDTVLMINKLSASKYNNILTITTLEKALEAQSKKDEEAKKLKIEEPLVTKIFSINYAKPSDLISILSDYKTEERGKITTEARTNKLIIKDTVSVVEKMKKIIEMLDTATPQILIESKIVEISETSIKDFGFNATSFTYNPFKDLKSTDTSPSPGFTFNSLSGGEKGAFLSFGIDVLKKLGNLDMSLKLLETQSKAKIISSPRVITQNNVAASINSTSSVPYKTTTTTSSGTTESWSQAAASTNLSVTPIVNNNGSIALTVSVNKSSNGNQPLPSAPPPQSSSSISTNVLVDNGSTVVLGGLYQITETESVTGIPFLKDIPILGWLFRSTYNPNKSKSELMVFITPSIVNSNDAGLNENSSM